MHTMYVYDVRAWMFSFIINGGMYVMVAWIVSNQNLSDVWPDVWPHMYGHICMATNVWPDFPNVWPHM